MNNILTDGSKIITEALVRSGAEVYIGYPITPSNLFYAYAQKRFPSFYAAPDEISTLQWMSGFAAAGRIPVSATAFPGLALMMESLNMAFAMELPMVLIISQRMGPSTGAATTGAQGDLSVLNGCISGGYSPPVFCPADFTDCWHLAHKAVDTALQLRTPVILLTSKEMVMTNKRFDTDTLPDIEPVKRIEPSVEGDYRPYLAAEGGVPPFLPVGNNKHRVRLNASTHDFDGLIKKNSPDALFNTRRLRDKFDKNIGDISLYSLDEDRNSDKLIVTYGISAGASRDAVQKLRKKGTSISLLILKTLLPVIPDAM
ncbi:MAG: hypothetical protein ACE5DN_07655, partial [Flavobacteriales bacterium]